MTETDHDGLAINEVMFLILDQTYQLFFSKAWIEFSPLFINSFVNKHAILNGRETGFSSDVFIGEKPIGKYRFPIYGERFIEMVLDVWWTKIR